MLLTSPDTLKVTMIALLTLLACASPPKPGDSRDSGATDTGDTGTDAKDPSIDLDRDGYDQDEDCDNTDATIYPGAPEICGNGVIEDCDKDEAQAQAACAHMLTEFGAAAAWLEGGVTANMARLAPLGDVNGDGFDDIGIGAVHTGYYDDTNDFIDDSGVELIFYGPVSGEVSSHDYDAQLISTPEWDYASWDTVPMGDMDGDGYDDFAVGASDTDRGPVTGTPSVYLVHGPVVDTVFGTDDMILLQGGIIEDCLGSVLEPTADADGDGFTDLLVGGRCQGQAHLISGDGHDMVPKVDDIAFYYVPDDGTGENEDSRFGHSLASGDLNGDGFLDVAVGAPEPNGGGPWLGTVSVFSGPQRGASSTEDADHIFAGAESDTQDGTSSPPEVQLGVGLTIGDWNGDGHDDLAVGAPMRFWGDSTLREGGAYIYYGPLDQADFGIPDADLAIVGDSDDVNCQNDKVGGEMDGDDDIDGDGIDDLLIGNGRIEVNGYSGNGMNYGYRQHAWVLLGPLNSGTMLAADADVVLASTHLTVENGMSYGGFGLQARVAGDTDGDGRKELLVGDWSAQLYLFDIADVGGY